MSAGKLQLKSLGKRGGAARDADLEAFRDISDDVIESDFVPYAGLLDPVTLATKNGEVLQILRITGLGYDGKEHGDLRAAIRSAIDRCIPDTSYALWLHTLRRKQTLVQQSTLPDAFSRDVESAWSTQHPAQASYINELYITIVKAAEQAEITNMQAFLQSLWSPTDRRVRTRYIEGAVAELTRTCDAVLQHLKAFGATRLGVVERNGACYGEHLEFLEKLINLEYRQMEIPRRDLSQVLTSGEITFGTNAMEVRTAEGHRRFATLLTVKEYKEASLSGVDKFLDIPCELIITQCFDFVGAEAAQAAYNTQMRYLTISGDKELAQWMEIDRLSKPGNFTAKSFGEQQTTIFIISPSVKQLEANTRMVQRALNRLGIVVIREDIRFEDCYWAQLPSNFPFIKRNHAIDTQHLAGFSNLQNQPMGNAKGSAWGPPVSLFSTISDTPYFFNFQREGNAHTLVMGPRGSGHTSMAHFLLTQARKLPMAIWYLDTRGRGEHFIKAMGGQYLTPGSAALQLNPLMLADTPLNKEFLSLWLSTLIDPKASSLNASSLGFFQQLVQAIYTLPPSQRRLGTLLQMVREQDAMLARSFEPWVAGKTHGELFDMPSDTLAPSTLYGINLSQWASNDAVLVPLVSYLLHRLTSLLNGTPVMLVLDEGFHLLKTPLYGPRAAAWFDHLSANNAAAMLMTSDIDGSGIYPYSSALTARAANVFAMHDSMPGDGYFSLGFNEQEVGAIAHMIGPERRVLLKRGSEVNILRADLACLSADQRTVLAGKVPAAATSPEDMLKHVMQTPLGAAV